jgi:hypothetical protein
MKPCGGRGISLTPGIAAALTVKQISEYQSICIVHDASLKINRATMAMISLVFINLTPI